MVIRTCASILPEKDGGFSGLADMGLERKNYSVSLRAARRRFRVTNKIALKTEAITQGMEEEQYKKEVCWQKSKENGEGADN